MKTVYNLIGFALLAAAAYAADPPVAAVTTPTLTYEMLRSRMAQLEDNRTALLSLANAIRQAPQREFSRREMLSAAAARTCQRRGELLIEVEHVLIALALDPPLPAGLDPMESLLAAFRQQLDQSVKALEQARKHKEGVSQIELLRLSELSLLTRFSAIEAADMNNTLRIERITERPRIHRILAALRRHEAYNNNWVESFRFAADVYRLAAAQRPASPAGYAKPVATEASYVPR